MIKIKLVTSEKIEIIETGTGLSLLDILRKNGYPVYAPCGGKGTCGKCMVNIKGKGNVISCTYYPDENIEVILPGVNETNILISQTEYLEDLPFKNNNKHISSKPYGVAIDIGTTTLVLYFLNLHSGQIEKIASLLNPQNSYGADVISRINYCQEHENGLTELQCTIINALNRELDLFRTEEKIDSSNFEKIIIAGNTTMLHILLGENPVSIALAPFKPEFIDKQTREGASTGLNVHNKAEVVTLPCISAYVGADIVAGLAALKAFHRNYLFLDIGTNGEIALLKGNEIFMCSAAAGPAFEGAGLSCGMGAVSGAISGFTRQKEYQVIGNTEPLGICGSGMVDIVAWLVENDLVDETGQLQDNFVIYNKNSIHITQQDIREIQLAKSAIYSGMKILLKRAGLSFKDIDALFLAGGFGNYINIKSALKIGLLPYGLRDNIYPVGNSAGIGALQYLKSDDFENKINKIVMNTQYIELSNIEEFTMEFALNMNFSKKN
ncbi:MAG: DUF4445 domain-containing protein [Bacteroidales bacterium]|nr:DUF4445 domain-containing protein [Bacteroidales bacterium]